MTDTSSSIKSVIDRISNPDESLTEEQLSLLSRLNSDDAAQFQQSFHQATAARRLQIISQITQLSETDLVPDFSKIFLLCLDDPDQFVRAQAILGLRLEEDEQFVTPLIHALHSDSSAVVRAAAAKSLGTFAALGEFEEIPMSCTDRIYTALENTLLNESETDDVKSKVLVAIAFLDRPKVAEFIEEAYYSGNPARKIDAIRAMGNACNQRWLDIILSELNNENTEVRLTAITACGEFGSDDAVPVLIDMAEDPEPAVQEAAIYALGEIGGDEVRETLNTLVESPRKRIRTAAKAALEEIKFCDDPLSWMP